MKKIVTILVVCALFISSIASVSATAIEQSESSSQNTEVTETNYDFKTFKWGDTREHVIEIEGEPLMDGDMDGLDASYIVYSTTVVGVDVLLAYYFCSDGLFQIRYISTEEHSKESLYIDDYNQIKKALIRKYGESSLDFENWDSDSHKSYYANKKGDALCYGFLTYSTWWKTDTSLIVMKMDADNYDISTSITYESLEISAEERDFSDSL